MCNTCNEILKKYHKNNPMYKQGDILVNENGTEIRIRGVCGEIIFISFECSPNKIEHSVKETLESLSFKLKQKEWEPKDGDIYWYISSIGEVTMGRFKENSSWDTKVKNFLGIFPTRELSEKRLEEIKKLLK